MKPAMVLMFLGVFMLLVNKNHTLNREVDASMYKNLRTVLSACPSVNYKAKELLQEDGIIDHWEYDTILKVCDKVIRDEIKLEL